MLINKKIRKFIIPPALVLLFFLSILVLANSLIQTESVQQYLIEKIFEDTGIEIETGKIEISLLGQLELSVEKCGIFLDNSKYCIRAPIIELTFGKIAMLKGEFYPSKIRIIEPEIEINAPENLNNFLIKSQDKKHNFI
jgi:hypothetical protein